MNHGRVVQVGSPQELYERPSTVFASKFIGKSNILRGVVNQQEVSKVLVVTELVSIVSEKVTETFDVFETEVSESEGELDKTVGGVVSVVVVVSSLVVDAPSSLLLAQEMTVRLKRDMRIMYKTLFIFFLHQ
jgi:ABC-type Fe3+/spermidine/putrescine transport system ATPase subunit